jgi:hypothetical protein
MITAILCIFTRRLNSRMTNYKDEYKVKMSTDQYNSKQKITLRENIDFVKSKLSRNREENIIQNYRANW